MGMGMGMVLLVVGGWTCGRRWCMGSAPSISGGSGTRSSMRAYGGMCLSGTPRRRGPVSGWFFWRPSSGSLLVLRARLITRDMVAYLHSPS
ncbi:hypothetical protein F5144DRAFT_395281 [Chaetomium tenue]|uniref:Uncharacterized protein n=1 Tax=Chaetomium tenue TaxID=1854479 RepID=A0ACB7NXU7_9PEZI|nr:hypothetical protein F5144DRAFT_395281 [Chaetomium globosum]